MKHDMKISEDDMFDEVDRRERIKMKCEICGKTIDGWCWLKGNKGQCYTCHTNMDNSDDEENIEFEEEEHSEDDIAIGKKLRIKMLRGLN